MDAWSVKELDQMRLGGNQRMLKYFKRHGLMDTPPIERYSASVMPEYRAALSNAALTGAALPPAFAGSSDAKSTSAPSSDTKSIRTGKSAAPRGLGLAIAEPVGTSHPHHSFLIIHQMMVKK
jgi:hypothetical protein